MILVLHEPATGEQIAEMLKALGSYVKLAVDTDRELVAGGGEPHADCEQVLLEDGSRQEAIWGADWDPVGEVRFESLINIRPRQGNRDLEIQIAGSAPTSRACCYVPEYLWRSQF